MSSSLLFVLDHSNLQHRQFIIYEINLKKTRLKKIKICFELMLWDVHETSELLCCYYFRYRSYKRSSVRKNKTKTFLWWKNL